MLRKFTVDGLFDKTSVDLSFHPDLNLITGKNGSGKTTLLKLMWYMLSSNLERTIPEVRFRFAELVTDTFSVSLRCPHTKDKSETVEVVWKSAKHKRKFIVPAGSFGSPACKVEIANRDLLGVSGSSLFFPTFRRVEGGFAIPEKHMFRANPYKPAFALSQVIREYASGITVQTHKFIASVSTDDVEELLTRQYASASEKTNTLHKNLSQYILDAVKTYEQLHEPKPIRQLKAAKSTLEKIRLQTATFERERETLLQTFTVLTRLVDRILSGKAVTVTEALVLGSSPNTIPAGALSAGEKQMLSFLCYNAFSKQTVILIDEPEISLHADWQRLLLSTLLEQKTDNQFIIATHSPLMYSRYPEKELDLDKLATSVT
jgi:ABC-type lipoprotein export system ATPase subunit